jgi:hypothetical protein
MSLRPPYPSPRLLLTFHERRAQSPAPPADRLGTRPAPLKLRQRTDRRSRLQGQRRGSSGPQAAQQTRVQRLGAAEGLSAATRGSGGAQRSGRQRMPPPVAALNRRPYAHPAIQPSAHQQTSTATAAAQRSTAALHHFARHLHRRGRQWPPRLQRARPPAPPRAAATGRRQQRAGGQHQEQRGQPSGWGGDGTAAASASPAGRMRSTAGVTRRHARVGVRVQLTTPGSRRCCSRTASWGAAGAPSCSSAQCGGCGSPPESGGTWSPCRSGSSPGACGWTRPS